MANFQILANERFLFFSFEFEAIIFVSFYIIYTYKLMLIGILERVYFYVLGI